jgi:hypothetical protein
LTRNEATGCIMPTAWELKMEILAQGPGEEVRGVAAISRICELTLAGAEGILNRQIITYPRSVAYRDREASVNTRRDYTRLGRVLVAATTLSVLALFVAVPRSHADDRAKCQQRIERAEARLHEAVSRYGPVSRQANDRRRDLNAERERCWNRYHAWWGPRDRQWHNERDWDRYDRDHDRDHDRDRDHDPDRR